MQRFFAAIVTVGLARVSSHGGSYAVLRDNATHYAVVDLGAIAGLAGGVTRTNWSRGNNLILGQVAPGLESSAVNYTQQGIRDAVTGWTQFSFDAENHG